MRLENKTYFFPNLVLKLVQLVIHKISLHSFCFDKKYEKFKSDQMENRSDCMLNVKSPATNTWERLGKTQVLSRTIILILHIPQKGIQENKVSKKKETLQRAENTFRRACDQTSADTEEATAEIPEDDTSTQVKNMRKQAIQEEKKKESRVEIGRMEEG